MSLHAKQIKRFFGGFDSPASGDLYVPDPLGRVDQGHFIKRRDLPDPFGRLPEPAKPERFDLRDIFSLSSPVGMTGKNRRGDVAKVEGLMGAAGEIPAANIPALTTIGTFQVMVPRPHPPSAFRRNRMTMIFQSGQHGFFE